MHWKIYQKYSRMYCNTDFSNYCFPTLRLGHVTCPEISHLRSTSCNGSWIYFHSFIKLNLKKRFSKLINDSFTSSISILFIHVLVINNLWTLGKKVGNALLDFGKSKLASVLFIHVEQNVKRCSFKFQGGSKGFT